ncbi:class F sortase [Streptomyces corynorhini]|uniref:Class F sortase n=1 Tax=Streptomyces corynorhini TaxID=2282652 RepID=A0A370BCF1_9ACTN|nr:class F sortase [Streptomyces corynorhini]RDG37125.1 class F sortase [Streptomyces corynorhini]
MGSSGAPSRAGRSRLLTGVAWAVLLLGLCVWGRGVGDGLGGLGGLSGLGGGSAPTTGDVAAVGRPPGVRLPPARDPLDDEQNRGAVAAAPPAVPTPKRVEIPSLGIAAPIVARGLDAEGAVDPPPYEMPDTVGWYADGVQPGAVGAALLVGHVDTERQAAVFYGLSAAKPGGKAMVTRADGRIAEFTIDDVRVVPRDRFDAKKVYGPREKNRAELRLITCGGTFDTKEHAYTANVVVSAYLTGVKEPRGTAKG